jgi:1-acyl-sn-glycerol-3-phosphate acyltransferase
MVAHRSRREKLRRRLISVPGLSAAAVLLTILTPVWLPVAVLVDGVRLKLRFPVARLLAFGVLWCWIEIAGVVRCGVLWAGGRSNDQAAHFEVMSWWSGLLMRALGLTIGIDPRVEGLEAVAGGNAIVLARHASLADSLLSGWVFSNVAALHPRYVLKRELLFDPCLDIVGLRVPNHFLDRGATDTTVELDALRDLGACVGAGSVGVIFAEGTRSNDRKRARALEKIGGSNPERAQRLSGLRRLLPPRPAGSSAFLEGAPEADVVLAWHTGFDGLDTFAGMIDKLSKPLPPVRFVMKRFARSDVPAGEAFARWLDDRWIEMDAEVDEALTVRA